VRTTHPAPKSPTLTLPLVFSFDATFYLDDVVRETPEKGKIDVKLPNLLPKYGTPNNAGKAVQGTGSCPRFAVSFELPDAKTATRGCRPHDTTLERSLMDIEKTIEFLSQQQAKFDANLAAFHAGMEELRASQRATERLINAFAKAGQEQIELHRVRLDSVERRMQADEEHFQDFLKRFDAFLQGRQGNGHGA
jgi:hypothetical protein